MCQYHRPIITGLLSILCISSPVIAIEQENNIRTLLQLSIEELMEVRVTAPSRRSENQLFAPGVITVVTAQEIRQFGARHLGDVLDRMVSTQIIGSHLFPHSKTSLRATNTWLNDNNILILLNGRPVRDERSNPDIYVGFPLGTIHHLEIIRGPGSVLYGTNAMAGVINIVTSKQPQKEKSAQQKGVNQENNASRDQYNFTEFNLGVGSFNRQQLQLTKASETRDYGLTLGINLLKAEGDDFDEMTDEKGHVGTYRTGEDSADLVASGRYRDFSFNTMFMENSLDSVSSFFQLPSSASHYSRSFFDVGYQHDLTKNWQTSFHYTLSRTTTTWLLNNENITSAVKAKAQDQLFDLTLQGEPMENLNVLLGANYSLLGPSAKYRKDSSQFWRKGAFVQADYSFTEKQKVIAGLQWNKPKGDEGELSPRIGFIQGFGEHWWLKLLYSEAFRSPSLVELFANAPALLGNPNLRPEKMATTDVQFIYQTPDQYVALTFYQSKFTDIISQTPYLGSSRVFMDNKGEINFRGVEFEGRLILSDEISLVGNACYQRNKDEKGVRDNTFSPSMMVKLGMTYTGKSGMTLSIFDSYIGEATDLSETLGNPAINPEAKAYHLLTANLSLDTGQLWKIGKPDYSFISLYLDNILNEKIYAPDISHRNRNNTIPHHWGFGAYLNYQYRF